MVVSRQTMSGQSTGKMQLMPVDVRIMVIPVFFYASLKAGNLSDTVLSTMMAGNEFE